MLRRSAETAFGQVAVTISGKIGVRVRAAKDVARVRNVHKHMSNMRSVPIIFLGLFACLREGGSNEDHECEGPKAVKAVKDK